MDHLQAYLRMSGASFEAQVCTTASNSPTGKLVRFDFMVESGITGVVLGRLPAVEQSEDLAQQLGSDESEYSVARGGIHWVQSKGCDCDAFLNASQKADVVSYSNLLASKLDTAATYCTWLEAGGFSEWRQASTCLLRTVSGTTQPPGRATSLSTSISRLHLPVKYTGLCLVQAAYKSVPFPLNWIIPYTEQRHVRHALIASQREQVWLEHAGLSASPICW
jgi:hypothetical protein